MEKSNVLKVIADMGEGYFLDWVRDFESMDVGVASCLDRIRADVTGSQPYGASSWEREEEALDIALNEYEEPQLDQILAFHFDIRPEEVGGSKAFFARLLSTIQAGKNLAGRGSSTPPRF